MVFLFVTMTELYFSFVIPVYNRPQEVEELLQSLVLQKYASDFEVVIVEDGSTADAAHVVNAYQDKLAITYLVKENTGPGDSRNYGMRHAKGNYFIILDSDCILPENYLAAVQTALEAEFVHCFGGPDAAHQSFTTVQKAINYAMTSPLSTGGIRGNKVAVGKFQPRSFNMGISKQAFEATNGFGQIHPGEDPDLTFRIWEAGFKTRLLSDAYVYHKRRINWAKFRKQVTKFGLVRPILNQWHPNTSKLTYWFPTVFTIGLITGLVFAILGNHIILSCYVTYFFLVFAHSLLCNKSLSIALLSVFAVFVQLVSYGIAFFKSTILLTFSSKPAEEIFPDLFFKKSK